MPPSGLREVDVAVVREAVASGLVEMNYRIPADILEALRSAAEREQSPLGRRTLDQIVRNYELAATERTPVCQDSGVTVVLLEVGQDVHWVGGTLYDAIDAGIREGTTRGYLRRSVVGDPLLRMTSDADPAGVIHVEIAAGHQVRLTLASKGFGAENMSTIVMLTPADGIEGVRRVVLETVERAGANACPPIIVGVGAGGTFERAALLAKKAVLRPLTERNPRPHVARLEQELLEAVNRLGIGPQGLGGIVTALAVNIEVHPTHIAGLPVAVNLGCHSNRRLSVEI
ncbi:MAG: fumarate hydratase [Dehalococcoidia bacterium]|nr:fumarate hydratase [Dehalococcoidia bacterium]